MLTVHPNDTPRYSRLSKLRRWSGLASLLLLQLLSATGAIAQDLHGKVCSTAVQLMLGASESDTPHSPQIDELRSMIPRLDGHLQPVIQRLVNSMDTLFIVLHHRQPLSRQQHEEFNGALLDALALLQPPPSNPNTPLADLPERLDFILVLYVSWPQIGSLRPALERRDSYLGWSISGLAESIEQDLFRDDWLSSGKSEQQRLLKDAQTRWKYIAKVLHRTTTEPAPTNVKKQIDLIREDLLQLRQQLELASIS